MKRKARVNDKNALESSRGTPYVVIQFLLFALMVFAPTTLKGWPLLFQKAWFWPGVALGILAGLASLIALFQLGRANFSVFARPTPTAEFTERGFYAWVRHPIYSTLIALAFAIALARGGVLTLLFALALLICFDFKSRHEERALGQRFKEYAAYRGRVKKLIPYLY